MAHTYVGVTTRLFPVLTYGIVYQRRHQPSQCPGSQKVKINILVLILSTFAWANTKG